MRKVHKYLVNTENFKIFPEEKQMKKESIENINLFQCDGGKHKHWYLTENTFIICLLNFEFIFINNIKLKLLQYKI